MESTGTNTSVSAVVEPIDDEYEFIQYNEKLRLIHSIKDDMYQAQSILAACNSKKQLRHWFDNKSTQELLESGSGRILPDQKLYEDRPNLPNDLKGMYVHRLLVNHIAMWASPSYAWDVMQLLDSLASQQRKQMDNKIKDLTTRAVPKDHQNSYRYMIWLEDLPKDKDSVVLHLVRRNKHSWRQVSRIYQDKKKRWIFIDDLPIAMTPNEDIKRMAKAMFKGDDVTVGGTRITIKRSCLNDFHTAVNKYFTTTMQS